MTKTQFHYTKIYICKILYDNRRFKQIIQQICNQSKNEDIPELNFFINPLNKKVNLDYKTIKSGEILNSSNEQMNKKCSFELKLKFS